MLLNITFSSLEPQITPEEYADFEASVMPRYTEYFQPQGVFYLGQFRPFGLPEFSIAQIHLVKAESCTVGRRMVKLTANAPQDIVAMDSVRRSLLTPGGKLNLWLKPIALTSHGRQRLDLEGRLLRFYFYVPHPGRSLDDFDQFERRTQESYASFMGQMDWLYLGACVADGLLERMYAGVDLVRAATPQEAMQREAAHPSTPEIEAILSEARGFREPGRELVSFWLQPALLSPLAQAGVLLEPS